MGIWLTGDIHGDPNRLNTNSFYEQKEMKQEYGEESQDNNFIIILGDFGLIWDKEESKNEKYWLDWLENKPFTTLFIDGNHENHKRLNSYPIKEFKGGKVHEIRPHVLHLMRGEIFNINNVKFFTFGGAASHDISDGIIDCSDPNWKQQEKKLINEGKYMFRYKDISWWKEEMPNKEEFKNGSDKLKLYNNEVDYILSHSPSTTELILMGGKGLYDIDPLTNYLDDIMAETEYKKHVYGHMHCNKAINDRSICLYEQIVRIQ